MPVPIVPGAALAPSPISYRSIPGQSAQGRPVSLCVAACDLVSLIPTGAGTRSQLYSRQALSGRLLKE